MARATGAAAAGGCSPGQLVFRGTDPDWSAEVPITVVSAEPPRRFSFRWVYDSDAVPDASNSLLVSFELVPSGTGTTVRMTETGFRERGWEIAVLEAAYEEHVQGWDRFVPRLGRYAAGLVSAS